MAKKECTGLDRHQRAFVSLIQDNSHRHRRHEVFSDFCELGALAISNSVDRHQADEREARYLQIVARYEPEEVRRFPEMLGHLTLALEAGHRDVLGQIFMSLDLGDHWKGQFFTPYELAYCMAQMTLTDCEQVIERQGFLTVMEPACGAGGMVIAAAAALLDRGINYQQNMHVTCIDVDATACRMTYLQLSLLHVPAVILQANALGSDPARAYWVTPAHVLGLWDFRLRSSERIGVASLPAGESGEQAQAQAPAPVDQSPDLVRHREAVVGQRIEQMSLFG